jgi:hypothetical protein
MLNLPINRTLYQIGFLGALSIDQSRHDRGTVIGSEEQPNQQLNTDGSGIGVVDLTCFHFYYASWTGTKGIATVYNGYDCYGPNSPAGNDWLCTLVSFSSSQYHRP